MPRFKITTLGCKVNQAESAAIAEEMAAARWRCAGDRPDVDVCIINTCTVTRKASMQSRQAIRQAMRAYPKARILVTGCYARTDPDAVVRIAGRAALAAWDDKTQIAAALGAVAPPEALRSKKNPQRERPRAGENARTRPFLKIQDGCDACCTYCIVPRARGRSRSLPVAAVLERLADLAAGGFQEVVLTGIHLGHYGKDLQPPASLFELLQRFESRPAVDRLRLSSIEPLELGGDILQLAAASNRICRHFHVPLQSGDDAVLKRMGRPYTAEQFRRVVEHIHQLMPDAAIGTDVMVGFPSETEQAHENTCRLIAELPLTYLHVFPFSARPGTPAAGMPGQIHPSVIKSRSRRLRRLGADLRGRFYRRFLDRTVSVLVETTRDGRTGMLKGFTANYLPVLLDGEDVCRNTIVEARITSASKSCLVGRITAPDNQQPSGGGSMHAAQLI